MAKVMRICKVFGIRVGREREREKKNNTENGKKINTKESVI